MRIAKGSPALPSSASAHRCGRAGPASAWSAAWAVGVLLACGSPLAAAAGGLDLRIDDGRVSIKARDIVLQRLLEVLAQRSGLVVITYVRLDERVTVDVDALPLERAVNRILVDHSYILQLAETRRLWVLGGDGASPAHSRYVPAARGDDEQGDGLPHLASAFVELSDPSPDRRENAIAALAEAGGVEALAAIAGALTDPVRDVRESAIEALAHIGGERSASALAAAMSDPDPAVRIRAVDALGDIGGPTALRSLRQALADGDGAVREAAAELVEELSRQ